jgi:hypothetical protein
VQCLTNAECAGTSTPVCSKQGRCAECVVDTDCSSAAPFCDQAHCVQCKKDGDCPSTAPKCTNRTCTP